MQRCTTCKANVKTHKQQKEEHARRQKLNYKEDHAEASQRNRLRREKCCRGWEAHSAYWTALIHLRCRAKVKAKCQVITLQQQPNLGPDRLTPLATENSSNQQGPKTMQKQSEACKERRHRGIQSGLGPIWALMGPYMGPYGPMWALMGPPGQVLEVP